MSRIEELIEFSVASLSEIDRIMSFIFKNVKPSHILANNKQMFLFEYQNNDKLNILIAKERSSGEIVGLYAFYIYSERNGIYDLAGGISQVSRECRIPFVGITLYEKIYDYFPSRSLVSVGMKRGTAYEINRRRNDTYMGSLSHFYMLSSKEEYQIAVIRNRVAPAITEPQQIELVRYECVEDLYRMFDDEKYRDRLPYKAPEYIKHRYYCHPVYKYIVYGVNKDLALVCREVEANGGKALRIVDVLGDASLIRHVGKALLDLIEKENYEYIDFMEFGMDEDDVLVAGFTKLDLQGPNIIPNYFEPFEQRNVEVLCCASIRPALIFKADADQDRPSIIRQ